MEVDCQSVKAKLDRGDPILLLDCREQSEWEIGHIDGALLLPMTEIQQRIDELAEHKSSEIVVYCHHGARSLRVAGFLKQQGYERSVSMAGGIDVWSQEIDSSIARY